MTWSESGSSMGSLNNNTALTSKPEYENTRRPRPMPLPKKEVLPVQSIPMNANTAELNRIQAVINSLQEPDQKSLYRLIGGYLAENDLAKTANHTNKIKELSNEIKKKRVPVSDINVQTMKKYFMLLDITIYGSYNQRDMLELKTVNKSKEQWVTPLKNMTDDKLKYIQKTLVNLQQENANIIVAGKQLKKLQNKLQTQQAESISWNEISNTQSEIKAINERIRNMADSIFKYEQSLIRFGFRSDMREFLKMPLNVQAQLEAVNAVLVLRAMSVPTKPALIWEPEIGRAHV